MDASAWACLRVAALHEARQFGKLLVADDLQCRLVRRGARGRVRLRAAHEWPHDPRSELDRDARAHAAAEHRAVRTALVDLVGAEELVRACVVEPQLDVDGGVRRRQPHAGEPAGPDGAGLELRIVGIDVVDGADAGARYRLEVVNADASSATARRT